MRQSHTNHHPTYQMLANFGRGKVTANDACVYRRLLAAIEVRQVPNNRHFFLWPASVQILIAASSYKWFRAAGTAHDRFS